MHQLEVPFAFAGFDVECNQAGAEQVVARAEAAVKVDGGAVGRNVNDAAFLVGRQRCPGRNVAGPFPRVVFPGFVAKLARSRQYVEFPQELAGLLVVAKDVAGNVLDA